MTSRKLTLAAVQMKFRTAMADNVSRIERMIEKAAGASADVILFPECAVTGYNLEFNAVPEAELAAALAAISRAARMAGCWVLVGCPTSTGGKRFNSLVVLDRRGRERFRYSKIHLTPRDAQFFAPGNSLALFSIEGIAATAIICHERRYPELVRLPVMLGAQIIFHPNAGLDRWAVSRRKRQGRDGIVARAFENEVYYVFANSVGRQGDGLWSAGDSKIVAPNLDVLALANNRDEMIIMAEVDVTKAGRKYAREALEQPAFLRAPWRAMLAACRRQLRKSAI